MRRLISTSTRVIEIATQRKGIVSEILRLPTEATEGRVLVLLDDVAEEAEFDNDILRVLSEKA